LHKQDIYKEVAALSQALQISTHSVLAQHAQSCKGCDSILFPLTAKQEAAYSEEFLKYRAHRRTFKIKSH